MLLDSEFGTVTVWFLYIYIYMVMEGGNRSLWTDCEQTDMEQMSSVKGNLNITEFELHPEPFWLKLFVVIRSSDCHIGHEVDEEGHEGHEGHEDHQGPPPTAKVVGRGLQG